MEQPGTIRLRKTYMAGGSRGSDSDELSVDTHWPPFITLGVIAEPPMTHMVVVPAFTYFLQLSIIPFVPDDRGTRNPLLP